MKLRPLADRVIVKRLENETKTASGILKTSIFSSSVAIWWIIWENGTGLMS